MERIVLILSVRTMLWVAAVALILFGSAATMRWPQAWVLLAEMGICGLALGAWLARHDPDLLRERLRPLVQRSQRRWDQVWMVAISFVVLAWLVVSGLDARRYGWSQIPSWAQIIGAAGLPVATWFAYLAFRENTFAIPVVRLQHDRGQQVVSSAIYGKIRHPMYAGAMFAFVGMPLLLGSGIGLAMAPVLLLALMVRCSLEERVLAAELPGYRGYMARVRYRLVPGVW